MMLGDGQLGVNKAICIPLSVAGAALSRECCVYIQQIVLHLVVFRQMWSAAVALMPPDLR